MQFTQLVDAVVRLKAVIITLDKRENQSIRVTYNTVTLVAVVNLPYCGISPPVDERLATIKQSFST